MSKIEHPSHYTQHPSGVECIDIAEHMPFNIGCAMKYLWRAGLKGDYQEDLKKAVWYIEREIARADKMDAAAISKIGPIDNTKCDYRMPLTTAQVKAILGVGE